jgi:hypothetical protein
MRRIRLPRRLSTTRAGLPQIPTNRCTACDAAFLADDPIAWSFAGQRIHERCIASATLVGRSGLGPRAASVIGRELRQQLCTACLAIYLRLSLEDATTVVLKLRDRRPRVVVDACEQCGRITDVVTPVV